MTETERVPLAGAGGNWFNAEKATRWEGDALGAPEETLFRTHLGGRVIGRDDGTARRSAGGGCLVLADSQTA